MDILPLTQLPVFLSKCNSFKESVVNSEDNAIESAKRIRAVAANISSSIKHVVGLIPTSDRTLTFIILIIIMYTGMVFILMHA